MNSWSGDLGNKPEELLRLNPYAKVPVLVDGDTVVYESAVINEYLEEKFPPDAADAQGTWRCARRCGSGSTSATPGFRRPRETYGTTTTSRTTGNGWRST